MSRINKRLEDLNKVLDAFLYDEKVDQVWVARLLKKRLEPFIQVTS